ncbi:phage tail tape measure protein [Ursidibacter sp. B-7004-1]
MPIAGLEYIIKLNDQISKPLKAIKGEIDRIGDAGKDAMMKIGAGAAGIIATGAALHKALQPAIELGNELGKIKGLGESDEGLEILRKRALAFSNTWGEAATEFVGASYDIKSAIDGLTTEELANFTELSAITGKATQTQGQIMTDYLGTMYSVLGASKEADKTKWAEKLLGQTAYTANKFKSDGAKIAEAFTTLGNQATLAGVDIAEQFAVLGTLQNEMGGGESATKYAAFLNSIGKAAEGLGIKVHDSQNKLLSTTVILDKIRARFGDTIDDLEAQAIKGEMGRKEGVAFINTLLQKNQELKKSIKEISDIDGMADVYAGAQANIDVFKRLSNIIKNIGASIGSQVLKKITPFLSKVADLGSDFVKWLETYKNIARWLGYIVGGIIALTAVVPLVLLLVGLFKLWGLAMVAIKLPLVGLGGASKMVFPSIIGFLTSLAKWGSPISLMFGALKRTVLSLLSPFKSLWNVGKGTFLFFKSGLATVISGLKTFFLAFTINPLLALKAVGAGLWNSFLTGIKLLFSPLSLWIALFAGIALFVYQFRAELSAFFAGVLKGFSEWGISFEPIKNGFSRIWEAILRIINVFRGLFTETQTNEQSLASWAAVGEVVGAGLAWVFQTVLDAVILVADLIEQVATIFEDVASIIITTWQDVLKAWGNGDYWGVFTAIGSGITNIFTKVLGGVKNMFFTFLNWLIDKINGIGEYVGIKLPKFEIEETPQEVTNATGLATSGANMALQMANSVGTQQLAPKPDASGQVFSLGSAQPQRLQQSPNISKTMQTTQNNQRYITIQKVEVRDGAELKRELQEGQMLNA